MINGMNIFYSFKIGRVLEPVQTKVKGKGLEPVQTKKGKDATKNAVKKQLRGCGLKILK